MALAPRDTPVTRDNVVQWYRNWRRTKHMSHKDWPTYLREKIDALDIEDKMILTPNHEGLADETHVADMILLDMDSYGFKK